MQHVEAWDGVAAPYRCINNRFKRLAPGKAHEDTEGDPPYHNEAKETNSSYKIQS